MTSYRPPASVKRIATSLIAAHHQHLDDVRIEYVFRSKAAKSKGKEVWGTARKVTGLNAYLAQGLAHDELPLGDDVDDLFAIEIAEDVWSKLNDKQRRALVDHELCHCTVDVDDEGRVILGVVGHDLEEFVAIVERHGLWREDVESFTQAAWEAQELPLGDSTSAGMAAVKDLDGTVIEAGGTTATVHVTSPGHGLGGDAA